MNKLMILGAGGYGRTVADIAEQLGYTAFFLDDNSPDAVGKLKDYINYKDCKIIPAFGNNELRLKWCRQLEENGFELATLIHTTAYVSPKAILHRGVVILPHAVVNTDVEVQIGCIVNIGALVDHGCILEEGVHIAPVAIVKGENRISVGTKIESGDVIALRQYPIA